MTLSSSEVIATSISLRSSMENSVSTFVQVARDGHDQLVEKLAPAVDQVQMAVRNGIERSGIDGDDVLQEASGGRELRSMILFCACAGCIAGNAECSADRIGRRTDCCGQRPSIQQGTLPRRRVPIVGRPIPGRAYFRPAGPFGGEWAKLRHWRQLPALCPPPKSARETCAHRFRSSP